MGISKNIRKIHWLFSSQFGIDPYKFLLSLRGMPRYLKDLYRFRHNYKGHIELKPCLHDWYKEGGITKSEYFWQDLLVAKMIYDTKPQKHVDIGSRIDGFVAHVASFREVEVFDIRPVTTKIPGVIFKQADLMNPLEDMENYCDSISCLHALEHFGLGRYGDPIDPKGFERGFTNMTALLKEGGIFYLSAPIGIGRVQFNANHIFDPRIIVNLAEHNKYKLKAITVIEQGGIVKKLENNKKQLSKLAEQSYSLGLFVFRKL